MSWLAPEILQQNLLGYNETSDIYSLAVTLCEMANGIVPFSEMPPTLMLLEKLRGAAPKLMDASTMGEPPAPEEQPELPGFLNKCRVWFLLQILQVFLVTQQTREWEIVWDPAATLSLAETRYITQGSSHLNSTTWSPFALFWSPTPGPLPPSYLPTLLSGLLSRLHKKPKIPFHQAAEEDEHNLADDTFAHPAPVK